MNRWRFFEVYGFWIWVAFYVAATALLVFGFLGMLSGCAANGPPPSKLPPEKADAIAECHLAIAKNVSERKTCPEAQVALNADAACHLLFPRGLDLDCPEFRHAP